jgi:hypothetical protein
MKGVWPVMNNTHYYHYRIEDVSMIRAYISNDVMGSIALIGPRFLTFGV